MACLLLLAVWFAKAFTFTQLVLVMYLALHALTVASTGVAVLTGGGKDLGHWTGVFANRNTLGPIAALAGISAIAIIATRTDTTGRTMALGLLALDLLVLIEAGSATAILAAVGAALTVPVTSGVHRLSSRISGRSAATAAIVVGTIVWFATFRLVGPVADALGRDDTLSNRRIVWQYLREATSERRIVGFGYSSFWDDPDKVYPLYLRTGSIYDSAHNSFYEVMVGQGLIGLALLLWITGVAIWRCWSGCWRTGSVRYRWWTAVATFVLIENLTESMITYHSIMWVLLIAAAFIEFDDGESPTDLDGRSAESGVRLSEPGRASP